MPDAIQDAGDMPVRITKVVDFRIPLWGVLSGATVVLWGLISMYFSLQQLLRDVADLQVNVKAGNAAAVSYAGELALIKFRVEKLEAEKQRLEATPGRR